MPEGMGKGEHLRYVSTRGTAPVLEFDEMLLAGLARDGGLYLPERWPGLDADALGRLKGLPYAELAARVMLPFLGGRIPEADFRALVAEAYRDFDHPAVAPLKELEPGLWLMELFHGPTLAFKDFALQLLGRLFDYVLARRGERVTMLVATSGDTGSAAIEGCRDRERIDIFVLHPKGRVSEVQRRQMTTVKAPNVHNIAIDGSFDDCQDLVKAMFNDQPFRDRMRLSAMNSINWARIMAQIVYYLHAALTLGGPERTVSFAVPTGNFGNVYAGYAARAMGLPVARLIVGSNRNDVLARFFESGELVAREVVPTLSPSMDIQVPSNFERLMYDLYDRDGAAVAAAVRAFRADGRLELGERRRRRVRATFHGFRLDDEGTKAEIARLHEATGELIDPHSAIGIAAAKAQRGDPEQPIVALATAHPAKFPEAVAAATGVRPALPPALADLMEREERVAELANDLAQVRAFVAERVGLRGAA